MRKKLLFILFLSLLPQTSFAILCGPNTGKANYYIKGKILKSKKISKRGYDYTVAPEGEEKGTEIVRVYHVFPDRPPLQGNGIYTFGILKESFFGLFMYGLNKIVLAGPGPCSGSVAYHPTPAEFEEMGKRLKRDLEKQNLLPKSKPSKTHPLSQIY